MKDQPNSGSPRSGESGKAHYVMQSAPTAIMNSYERKNPWIQGRRGVSIVGYSVRQYSLAVGSYRTARGRPGEPIPIRHGTSHGALPRTQHEEADQPKPAGKENPVDSPRPRKESQPEFFSGHVAPTSCVHELVTSDEPSLQAQKEATGHSTGHQ
jgi:hypothetical protein